MWVAKKTYVVAFLPPLFCQKAQLAETEAKAWITKFTGVTMIYCILN